MIKLVFLPRKSLNLTSSLAVVRCKFSLSRILNPETLQYDLGRLLDLAPPFYSKDSPLLAMTFEYQCAESLGVRFWVW
jgi:hypothetical protein